MVEKIHDRIENVMRTIMYLTKPSPEIFAFIFYLI